MFARFGLTLWLFFIYYMVSFFITTLITQYKVKVKNYVYIILTVDVEIALPVIQEMVNLVLTLMNAY